MNANNTVPPPPLVAGSNSVCGTPIAFCLFNDALDRLHSAECSVFGIEKSERECNVVRATVFGVRTQYFPGGNK
jgi:hypothetical protein